MIMQAQKPAEGIMMTHDFGDSKFYRVACTCGNNDDAIDFIVEVDEDIEEVQLSFTTTQKTDWWKELAPWETYKIDNSWIYSIVNSVKSLINGLYHRLSITRDVWVHGYVKYESTTFLSKQQALNLSQTIVTAIGDIEDFKTFKTKKE